MSISRRGLTAAGLAIAVVGTMGVMSTMNAGAAETPTPAASSAAPEPDGSGPPPEAEPPALLPWGAEPEPIDEGDPGDSSRELTASGASAVDDPDAAATTEEPKGEVLRQGAVHRSETDVPPAPPSTAAAATASQVTYSYAVGRQYADPEGVAVLLKVSQPDVAPSDWHSLAELAVQSADSKQIVEVGWIVNSGDSSTHLFVYHWVNGQPTCYNACGFVPYPGATIAPGATLATDVSKQFGVQHYNGAWWIAYDSEWIGSFPDALWNGGYTETGLVQVFGEVAASSGLSCTEMGNGSLPLVTSAAKASSVTYVNGPTPLLTVYATNVLYPVLQSSSRTFRFGGPGVC